MAEPLGNNEAAEAACKSLGQAVVACVRASSSLPLGRDHEYFSSFPKFRRAMEGDGSVGGEGGAGGRVLGLIERILKHQTPNVGRLGAQADSEVRLLVRSWRLWFGRTIGEAGVNSCLSCDRALGACFITSRISECFVCRVILYLVLLHLIKGGSMIHKWREECTG